MDEQTVGLDLTRLLPDIDLHEDDCVHRLEEAMQNVHGIHRAHRSEHNSPKEICLHFDPLVLSSHDVQRFAEIESAKLIKKFSHAVIPIDGMDCSDCAFVLKHSLEHEDGVMKLEVSFSEQLMKIEFDTQQISQNAIESQIRRMGYSVPKRGILQFINQNQHIILSSAAGISLLLGWVGEIGGFFSSPLSLAFYAVAYLLAGVPLLHQSLQQIVKERRFDTDQLMVAAGIGAAILGEFAEGALLLFLFSLGHALENRALNRAREAIHSLAELVPKVASVRRGSREEMLPVEQIQINDIVIVPPGARIPVDGNIHVGSSSVDQSSITGESIHVDVSISDRVFAGSVNGEGALEIATSRLSKDSTLSRIVQLVQDAQATKSPLQRYSDSVIRYLVPSILVIDALLIIVPPIFGVPFQESFLMAMTLLVAASPCALALGTPSAILASIARAARSGVLIKGGAHLENLGDLEVIAFDKTGTLTKGKPVVTDLVPLPSISDIDLLEISAAVEVQSAHPIAEAIVSAAQSRKLEIPHANSVQAKTGIGIEAMVSGQEVSILKFNSDSLADQIPDAIQKSVHSLERQGKTVIQIIVDSTPWGFIGLSDEIRPEAPETIKALRGLGIQKMIMLTGDNKRVAAQIAGSLELDEFMAELMPEEKLDVIKSIRLNSTSVAMVGDGVNDAPALAAASTGIAMGGAKTHVALESSDVVLMADDLSALPFVIELSNRTRTIIRQNFILALGVITGLIALTLTNLAGIALAIVIHEGSTLLVVFNALRLLGFQSKNRLA
jgi:Cd2+/Zn2+-exporting ATPase